VGVFIREKEKRITRKKIKPSEPEKRREAGTQFIIFEE
jgi:hypothetical protein